MMASDKTVIDIDATVGSNYATNTVVGFVAAVHLIAKRVLVLICNYYAVELSMMMMILMLSLLS